MNQQNTQTLKGFRDFLPSDMYVRNYVKNTLTQLFETSGFQPLETPALEYSSVLKGKYGSETDDKLGYFFKDNGDREVGLRYDLTVPTSKVLAIYSNQLPLPFRRYQIQPVWRAENTQKGRYREFIQCDIDIFGTTSPIADAEIISIIYQGVKKLGFKNATIKINSRSVLSTILSRSGITERQNSVLQSLDKLDKINENGVKDELTSKGLNDSQISQIFEYIKQSQPDENLKQVLDLLKDFGLPQNSYVFDPTLVRGCDYYTGTIFEVQVPEANGSIGGGGRYDNLVATLGGPQIPAVGFSFGFERVIDVIKDLKLLPPEQTDKIKILIANLGPEIQTNIINLTSTLRDNNISSVIYPNNDKLGKQIKYALNLGIPYLAIIGTDEVKNNQITLKNLSTSEQKIVSKDDLVKILKD
ncbi:MAG: histidine--tRNA ligase [Candidatus Shapirobacteria bacterium]|nr:histidine--tRNA ligase [Candidatus Shapirobacteria bacterium]